MTLAAQSQGASLSGYATQILTLAIQGDPGSIWLMARKQAFDIARQIIMRARADVPETYEEALAQGWIESPGQMGPDSEQ